MPKKQASGLYRTKVKIGVDANGKDINKWISGKTKRELEEARREVEERYIYHTASQEDQLFGAYAVQWFNVRKRPGLSPSQLESYRTALNRHILPKFSEHNLRSVTPVMLQEFLNTFEGCSATKITMIISTLRGIFGAAFDDRIVMFDPTLHLKKPVPKDGTEKRALTLEERERVENVCESYPDGLYLALLYYLGVRPGEARGLQWGDVDWDAHTIHVQRDVDYKDKANVGKLKTKSSDRLIPMPSKLESLLWPHRGLPAAFIVSASVSGGALSKSTAERMWIRLMSACDMVVEETVSFVVEEGKDNRNARDPRFKCKPLITPHTMRHNYATMCWENEIDVYSAMRLLGHSSIKTTMDIYTHLTNSQLSKMTDMVDDMFSGNKSIEKSCTKVAHTQIQASGNLSRKK